MDLFYLVSSAIVGVTFGYTLMAGPGKVYNTVTSSILGSVEGAFYGQGMGMVFRSKKNIFVKTDQGVLRVPSFQLPNLETELYYIYGEQDKFETDKLYPDEVLNHENYTIITTYMHNILPELLYAPCDMWICVSNEFEGQMYPHFVRSGEIIDYKAILDIYENKIEDQ